MIVEGKLTLASFSNAFTSHDEVKRRANKDRREAKSKKYWQTFFGTVLVSEPRSHKMLRDGESLVTKEVFISEYIRRHLVTAGGNTECNYKRQSELWKQAER